MEAFTRTVAHDPHHEPTVSHYKAWLAIGLSWVAGFVDLVGYLKLDHILNANMSGNTVELAWFGTQFHLSSALPRGWTILMFLCGLFLSALIHEASLRRRVRPVAAISLGLELALLIAFVSLSQPSPALRSGQGFYLLLALPAIAMGLQNATLTRVGALSVRTTHITGTLSKFAEATSRYFFWLYDHTRGAGKGHIRDGLRLSRHHADFRDACLTAALWFAFLFGAGAAGLLYPRVGVKALAPPIVLLCLFIVLDLRRPFSEINDVAGE